MTEAGPGEGAGQYLQFVTDPGAGPGGDLGAFTSGQAPVYVSPSLYPSSSSPTTTTYYDTTPSMAGYTQGRYHDDDDVSTPGVMSGLTNVGAPPGQSQLVSYGGSTFLIQPAPDGSSAPLITAVTAPGAREDQGDPGLGAGAMSAQGGSCHHVSRVTHVIPSGEVSPQHSLSYATRVSPATIQWLIANYETAEVSHSIIMSASC